jgi:acyl dehydratase
MTSTLHLEDLTVGQVFTSGAITLTADDIKAFAAQFDPQPFHTDENLAQDSFFGQLVASGWHTAGTTMRLMIESIPIAGGLIGAGVDELRWHRPVLPGDALQVESEILSIRRSKSRPDQGFVRFRHTTFNQRREVVQFCTSTTVVPARSRFTTNPGLSGSCTEGPMAT